jgi:hypothetical protein
VRRMMFALIALLLAIAVGSLEAAAAECATGDSAICLADPNCHWDGEKRGCYPGPGEKRDACAAHGTEGICNTSSLGCKWSDSTKQCESKGE